MSTPAEQWLSERTFHHEQFADLESLLQKKEAQGLTVSVCVPTLNEEATIGPIVSSIRRGLVEPRVADELVVVDSHSTDATARIARAEGAEVVQDTEILPDLEPSSGKGEALWKALFVLKGDLIVWVDADIEDFHPRFVYGPLGPLLADPSIGYVKAFYERPLQVDGEMQASGGGRVTELVARPLINMFWPELAALLQPLAGEYAARRDIIEQVPFFTDYGVEFGLLVDVWGRFGLDALAQVDLGQRIHRNRSLEELSPMAFAVIRTALKRLEGSDRAAIKVEMHRELLQFAKENGDYRATTSTIEVIERPPAASLPEYRSRT